MVTAPASWLSRGEVLMAARNAGLEREIIGHRFGSCVTVSPVGAGVDFTPDDVRAMQGQAQQVTGLRPELLGGGATVGELAWNRGQGRTARGGTWQRRLIYGDGELTGRAGLTCRTGRH
jgi:hypothetical protein